jgi:hypothetical protein
LIKRIDEGDHAKILLPPSGEDRKGSVTRSMYR